MAKWGSKWGGKWGCGDPAENIYLTLCRDHTWKQAEEWPNIKKFCEVAARSAFSAHNDAVAVEKRLGVPRARGDEQDSWGDTLDFPRFGASDTLYRFGLQAAGRALFGSGRPEDFHDVIEIVKPGALGSLQEIFPACVRLFLSGLSPTEEAIVFGLLEDVPGLGICLQKVETFGGQVFQWGHTDGDVPVTRHWDALSGGLSPSDVAGWAVVVF